MTHAKHITVTGHVQGVFFRASAKEEAEKLGLSGWVVNDHDGSVKIHAEGDEKALEAFSRWCNMGPPTATVETVEVREAETEGHEGFDVRL